MLRVTIKLYLIVYFLSNLPQPKIIRISFSDLNKIVLVLLYNCLPISACFLYACNLHKIEVHASKIHVLVGKC